MACDKKQPHLKTALINNYFQKISYAARNPVSPGPEVAIVSKFDHHIQGISYLLLGCGLFVFVLEAYTLPCVLLTEHS